MTSLLNLWKIFIILVTQWKSRKRGLNGAIATLCSSTKFKDLESLLTSRILSLGVKSGIYAACAPSIMLHGSAAGPVKKDVIKLDKNNAEIVGWMCNVRSENKFLLRNSVID